MQIDDQKRLQSKNGGDGDSVRNTTTPNMKEKGGASPIGNVRGSVIESNLNISSNMHSETKTGSVDF